METGGEVGTIEEHALLGLDGTKRSSRATANGALRERSASEGAVLLRLCTVGGEGVRKDTGGRSRVRSGAVVNRF